MPIEASTVWPGARWRGFFEEAGQAVLVVDLEYAEPAGLLGGNLQHRQGGAGAAVAVEAQHLGVIHLVDVIAGQHDEMPRLLAQDGIEILVDGVGGAEVPVLADALLRAQNLDELAELVGHHAPPHAQVTAERERLVLQRDEDAAQPRIDAVAEGEVDDPVGTAEIHRRLRPFLGQRIEPFANPASQHHYESIVLHVDLSAPGVSICRGAAPEPPRPCPHAAIPDASGTVDSQQGGSAPWAR